MSEGSHEQCDPPAQDGHCQYGHSDPADQDADLDPLVLGRDDVRLEIEALIQQTVVLVLEERRRVLREHLLVEFLLGDRVVHSLRSRIDRDLGGDDCRHQEQGGHEQHALQQVREDVGRTADQRRCSDGEGTASGSQEVGLRVGCPDDFLRVLGRFPYVLDRLLLLCRGQ